MSTHPPPLLPRDVLLGLLPATFEPWGSSGWYPAQAPTEVSVGRVETELGIRLPPLLIAVARACPSYGGVFGSIGEDVRSHNHMLRINRDFREEGLPPRYVLLNHGHDGDCNAWDVAAPPAASGELPIVYFNYDVDRRAMTGLRASAATFAEFIDALVRTNAPRCPVKGLRRRAKRVLAAHTGPGAG